MRNIAYLFVALAALATLTMGLYPFGGSMSLGEAAFDLWTMSPYFFMAWLIKASEGRSAVASLSGLCFLVGLFGLAMIFYVVVVVPDPQSGIAYFYTPLLQWIALLVLGLPLRACLNTSTSSGSGQGPDSDVSLK